MEAVSAVKMRKSQMRAFDSRPYVHTALRILSRISGSEAAKQHPLAGVRTEGKTLLVLVTSDKGLAGSVNSAVLKQAEDVVAAGIPISVIAIGRKAVEFAAREKLTVLAEYTNVSDDVSLADIREMAEVALQAFATSAQFKNVAIIYQNFLSTFEQEATKRQILPLDPEEIHYIMRGIRPRTGQWSEDMVGPDAVIDYKVEPSAEAVLDVLIPQLVQIMFFHALMESKASEHSARMVAMKNATDKSKEVTKALTLVYNKERQAAITAEVSEITGGMEALKK